MWLAGLDIFWLGWGRKGENGGPHRLGTERFNTQKQRWYFYGKNLQRIQKIKKLYGLWGDGDGGNEWRLCVCVCVCWMTEAWLCCCLHWPDTSSRHVNIIFYFLSEFSFFIFVVSVPLFFRLLLHLWRLRVCLFVEFKLWFKFYYVMMFFYININLIILL